MMRVASADELWTPKNLARGLAVLRLQWGGEWRTEDPRGESADSEQSDGFFEFLGSAEGHFFASLDLNRLAGCGITSHARGALAHLKDAEAANADALALLQMLDDIADKAAEDRFSLLLRKLVVLREARGEMFQSNGSRGCLTCH